MVTRYLVAAVLSLALLLPLQAMDYTRWGLPDGSPIPTHRPPYQVGGPAPTVSINSVSDQATQNHIHGLVMDERNYNLIIDRLMHGYPVDSLNRNGNTPLYFAVVCNKPKIVYLLVQHGADPELIKDKPGVAQKLAQPGYEATKNALLGIEPKIKSVKAKKKKRVTVADNNNNSTNSQAAPQVQAPVIISLSDALETNNPEAVERALRANLTQAVTRDHVNQVILTNPETKVSELRRSGSDVTYEQYVANLCRILDMLLGRNPALVRHVDDSGNTLLHKASEIGCPEIIEHLVIQHGAQLDARNGRGYTPLYCATMFRKQQAVNKLLLYGAREDAQARDNTSAYSLAQEIDNPAIREIYFQYIPELRQTYEQHIRQQQQQREQREREEQARAAQAQANAQRLRQAEQERLQKLLEQGIQQQQSYRRKMWAALGAGTGIITGIVIYALIKKAENNKKTTTRT